MEEGKRKKEEGKRKKERKITVGKESFHRKKVTVGKESFPHTTALLIVWRVSAVRCN
jgi:hypothetical protein